MTVYDPNDVAKTTIKETNIHNEREGNMSGPKKLMVYDPNDVARTTIKELIFIIIEREILPDILRVKCMIQMMLLELLLKKQIFIVEVEIWVDQVNYKFMTLMMFWDYN